MFTHSECEISQSWRTQFSSHGAFNLSRADMPLLPLIPKPNCSCSESINSRCRRFYLLLFHPFASICVAAMTGVVVVQIVTVPAGRWQSIDRNAVTAPFQYRKVNCWLIKQDTRAATRFRDNFGLLFAYTKIASPN